MTSPFINVKIVKNLKLLFLIYLKHIFCESLRISILCFNWKINLVTIVTVLGPDDKVRQFNWTQFVCGAVPRSHGSLLSPLLYLCIVSVNGSNCALMSPARLCRVEHGVETGESMPGPRSTFLLVELSPGQCGGVTQRQCCILGVGDTGTTSRVEKGKTLSKWWMWDCDI